MLIRKQNEGRPLCQFVDTKGLMSCVTPQYHKNGGIQGRCRTHGGIPECQYTNELTGRKCTKSQQWSNRNVSGRCAKHGGGMRCACGLSCIGKKGRVCSTCDPSTGSVRTTKQVTVGIALREAGMVFDTEVRIDCECTDDTNKENKYAKIDFVIYQFDKIICLEVDEHQHAESGHFLYTTVCDVARMTRVQHSIMIGELLRSKTCLPMLPTLWIRYNPDAFKFGDTTQHVPTSVRLQELVNTIKHFTITAGKQMIVMYMYFDRDHNDQLCILPQIDPIFYQVIHDDISKKTSEEDAVVEFEIKC